MLEGNIRYCRPHETKAARTCILCLMKSKEAWLVFGNLSVASSPSFSKEIQRCTMVVPWLCVPCIYVLKSILFQPWNIEAAANLYCKLCLVCNFCTKERGIVRGSKSLVSFKGSILRAFSLFFLSIEKELPVTGWHVGLSRGEVSGQLNGLFHSDDVPGLIEGKYFQMVDMVFPFFVRFWARILHLLRMET